MAKYKKVYDEPSPEWHKKVTDFINSSHKNLYKVQRNLNNKRLDLVADLTVYLYRNEKKLKDHTNLEAFSVKWMANNSWWNHDYKMGELSETKYIQFDWQIDLVENPSKYILCKDSELDFQTDPDLTEEELDLSSVFTDDQIEKIMTTKSIVSELSKAEQILFRLYFMEDMSTLDLEKHLNIPRTPAWKMVNTLIKKIKEKYDELHFDDKCRVGDSVRV